MTSTFSENFLLEAERHAAWGAAQLDVLGAFLPDGPWTADLPSCVYRQGDLELRVAVLGTYDTEERSWMWGWANPGLRGTEVVELPAAIARYGRAHAIPELTAEVLDLSGFDDPRRAAEMLAFTGMGVAEAPGYIGVPAGPGTRVYFLPDDARVPRAELDPVSLPRLLLTGAGLIGHSARQVVHGYFDHHGVPQRAEGDRIVAELPAGNAAVVGFDELGRISGIDVEVLPGGAHAGAFG
ncbi:DUF6882 domain-containing protein [Streptomyces vietnamensis]|uniref:Uncharacterized protein n=1 Tax=Streptomyces vietnamensis TaxID=362257 RepID=A0A0B5I3Z2_9ACTN|nr:DUF6882 domain-containing protein [Streptomyces vietnamensis]AJF68815.1 hypothetical protein SVTN_35330 [Streptomyces vietnamensis]